MKCMSKSVMATKQKLEAERERQAEEIRWNSLTPEQQEAELADREARHERVFQILSDLGKIINHIGGPYSKL